MDTFTHIRINENSRRPKYRQIVDSITDGISAGHLQLNQKIPSINALSEEFYLSRDTVEKAYNILKERRIITSVRGKGFYVTSLPRISGTNVLFVVNKLSTYKMRIYQSFINAVGPDIHTDLRVYHCEERLFLNALRDKSKAYDYYVIMPHFRNAGGRHAGASEEVDKLLAAIPPHKLLFLDDQPNDLTGKHSEIYQDFENDIYEALKQGWPHIQRYERLVMSFPSRAIYPYPRRILRGFRKFCVEVKRPFQVIESIPEHLPLERGTLYLTVPEDDLVNLVRAARDQQLTPGEDIGIISYNETPLKDLLGITTVSTDFDEMGRRAAELVTKREQTKMKNPFLLTCRRSV